MIFGQWMGKTESMRMILHMGTNDTYHVKYTNNGAPPTTDRMICFGPSKQTDNTGRHVRTGDWVIVNDDGTLFRELDYLPMITRK
jgi:hypothetical protein